MITSPASPAYRPSEADRPETENPAPLRAVLTTNLPALLRQLGVSLLVTTYQAGKLVRVRDEGDHLNTHFRALDAPMGMALAGGRLAVGTKIAVCEYVDVPGVAAGLDPPGKHDACFLPRSSHVTGNIQIHEMAWGAGGKLWVVNTRFSCLCTLNGSASFAPQWRPPFVSALEPTDRCHLNGLGMVDGRPRYITALGETDEPAGWRANKARGGILMDVASGEVITGKLSMPHSPRWYGGRLWVCESGAGTFGFTDPNTGKYEQIAELPGFTRGVDFAGNLAFVGLSQVRESAVFSGIAITNRLSEDERTCGICAIDLRSAQVVALLRFETGVQEVFAVTVLPGRRYPDLINEDDTLLANSFVVPEAALADVPASLWAPAEPTRGAQRSEANRSAPSGRS
jgi:uncharacterized protein (TIGR03032 family)